MYQVFIRLDKRGSKWQPYSAKYEKLTEATEAFVRAYELYTHGDKDGFRPCWDDCFYKVALREV